MRVLCLPAGIDIENDGCSQYRLVLPGQALIDQGADVVITRSGKGPKLLYRPTTTEQRPDRDHVMGLAERPNADVIVLQRPAMRKWPETIPFLQKAGVRVVVDVDDRLDILDHGHVGRGAYNGIHGEHFGHQWTDAACKLATLVTVTTPALLERYGYGHGVILPNMIPERYLTITNTESHKLGWSGTVETHPKDLPVVSSAVRDALKDTDWSVHIIGTAKGVKKALRLREEPMYSGWVPFVDYPKELSRLDIGIVPLANTPFNKAKSSLKMAEMASLGVVPVASPTPDNRRLFDLRIGTIAKNPTDWKETLTALIEKDTIRVEMREEGREVMKTQTIEAHCGDWWDAWTGAIRPNTVEDAMSRLAQIGVPR